jgi:hypothetical protein
VTIYALKVITRDQYGASELVGVYSTELLAKEAANTSHVRQYQWYVVPMEVDAAAKVRA